MEQSNYLSNFSYIFIPFCIENEKMFHPFNENLEKDGKWIHSEGKISYLHRYVSDRLISENKSKANLFRYYLDPSSANNMELCLDKYCYGTHPKKFNEEDSVTFDFKIIDVQLFSFNTSICMLVYKLNFVNNDPLHIAAAQYYLRKINTEPVILKKENEVEVSKSFIDISKGLLGDLVEKYNLNFFFYSLTDTERANFFTYLDLPKADNYDEELFYLKWCYNGAFVYKDESVENDCINYVADTDKVWGISPSAAVCIINRNEKNKNFIENVFQKNFQNQYLFTYVFLLHQKYMLYLFLTKISIDIDDDLNLLEDYKRRLYEFDTKYIFAQISEVPQYQRFYEKVMKCFKIKEMFDDVQDPLSHLVEIQRLNNEARQQRHDHSINTALVVLSLLTIVSAITDASGITSNLGWLLPPIVAKVIQLSTIILVIVISVLMIIRLLSIKNKHLF